VQRQLGDVEQFLEALDEHDTIVPQQRFDHGVVAGKRAGMRLGRFAGGSTMSRQQQDDRLAELASPCSHREKALRLSNLLGEGNNHLRCGIFEQIGRVVLEPEHRLISGRDRADNRHAFGRERRPHDARKSAALRDDDGTG
jgi:hypothetical protein